MPNGKVKKKEKEKIEKNEENIKDPDKEVSDAKASQKKSKSKRNKAIIITILIIVVAIALIILLWDTGEGQDYPTVSKILDESEKHIDKEIEFRGTVKKDTLDVTNRTFVLTDDKKDLRVNYTDLLPSNFEEGKDVVVRGILRQKIELVVEAEEITVGCASKY
jgi:cytochrome c-type biogenesis protein CcmE